MEEGEEKERKKKREEWLGWGIVFLGPDPLCWMCHQLQLLCAIKGRFKGQSLNFFSAPNVMVVIILARSNQNSQV
jgi:hypothetical protein